MALPKFDKTTATLITAIIGLIAGVSGPASTSSQISDLRTQVVDVRERLARIEATLDVRRTASR